MRVIKYLLITALVIGLVVAIAAYIGQARVTALALQPLKLIEPQSLLINPGTSFRSLIKQLTDRDLIEQPLLLRFYARQQKLAHRIQAGEYLLEPGLTHSGLLQMLVAGRVRSYQVTLVEGQTVKEMVAVLQAHPQVVTTLERSDPEAVALKLGIEGSAEGWIYPDTYQFTRGTTDLEVLQRAYSAMQKQLAKVWAERADKLPLKTPYEALILASIVEKETGAAEERPEIASVFIRRLEKGMRLQTDPTVIYGMGDTYKGNITRADLKAKTAFNTYTINGLPPTPIANSGYAALHAAVNPAASNALYFVARGDGTHQFSKTLQEHNQAVTQYQRSQRRKDYRSSISVKNSTAVSTALQSK